jgi:GH15 family glucan-1,4-alpha-glucosidase
MATIAAAFAANQTIEIRIPLEAHRRPATPRSRAVNPWADDLETFARMRLPDERLQRLYDIAVRTVILHSPGEVYPGPYTYKRFWYRDAALILNSLITLGATDRARRALDLFPRGQLRDGYFRSQEGEWDSNGQVLWILHRYHSLTGENVPAEWLPVIDRGARWILQKRMGTGAPHPGLLPAGFSAEHLGPNDFYYWDDFWGVAGLRAASEMLSPTNSIAAREFNSAGQDFMHTILRSLEPGLVRTGGAMPAAPDRRMDSGAVGSLVADFPLQLLAAGDPLVMKSIEWLLAHSFVRGGFFQNMIHSGINAYLTLHVAQVLLRAGDQRAHQLIDAVAALASPTGQWPEAIHPRTLGG